MVEILEKYPLHIYIKHFFFKMMKFDILHGNYFVYEEVSKYLGPVSWKSRFSVLIYFIAIDRPISQNYFPIFRTIVAKNMHMLTPLLISFISSRYYQSLLVNHRNTFSRRRKNTHLFRKIIVRHFLDGKNKSGFCLKKVFEYYFVWELKLKHENRFKRILRKKSLRILKQFP
jgi:hypothetical protein